MYREPPQDAEHFFAKMNVHFVSNNADMLNLIQTTSPQKQNGYGYEHQTVFLLCINLKRCIPGLLK